MVEHRTRNGQVCANSEPYLNGKCKKYEFSSFVNDRKKCINGHGDGLCKNDGRCEHICTDSYSNGSEGKCICVSRKYK